MSRLAGTLLSAALWAATVPGLPQQVPGAATSYNQITGLATVSEFIVAGGMLRPVIGDKVTCMSDQAFVLEAQKSPVTCYFFLSDAALTLFGHYGFPTYYPGLEMGTVIREFKQEELTPS